MRMKKFNQMFAQAVKLLLEEQDKKKPKAPNVKDIIVWKNHGGRWRPIIKGLKKESESSYDELMQKSSASGAKALSLMAKLGVINESKSKDDLQGAYEILQQAVKNPAMSELYDTPTIDKNTITVPVKLPMDPESVNEDEGVLPRNATVWIHLTLVGAYNSRMFKPQRGVEVLMANKNGVVIKRI